MAAAAREVKISYASAKAKESKLKDSSGASWSEPNDKKEIAQDPIPRDQLCPEALRALDDFEFFRLRYFGHISSPWQITAAEQAVALLESEHKEFVVVNCPPGAGKTTLFTHDIPAWLTVRNRSIRGIIGSRTFRQAEMHCGRLRRTFERTVPTRAKDEDRNRGLAVDATGVLAKDYGRFKPDSDEIWQRGQFTIAQAKDTPLDEKESSWTAFGQDSGSLGWRVNYITWDDVVDKTTIRTAEAIEKQREWWDDEAETRLEPGGVLVLPGQRLSASDLYRYCLDKLVAPDDDEDEESDDAGRDRKYRHIIYKAHDEDRCEGIHKPSEAKPYPDGCLLDPKRLPWRELRAEQNKPKYRTVYQQEDVDESSVLVQKIWVDGGRGVDGVDYPGCWDANRGLGEFPQGLGGTKISVVTCDPSPTRFWSIQWWAVHVETEQRFLLDLVRQSMDAPDFLDYVINERRWVGLLEEWWQRANDKGLPFTHLVVEANAAQRFMLQYDTFKRWASARGVNVIPHETHRNKSDANYGVQSIAPHYRYGRVRLPGKQGDPGRIAALKLVDEVTKWPDGQYDDCVMSQWFLEWTLPNIVVQGDPDATMRRPRFLQRGLRRPA